ncbi:MAG: inositol monophosphatase family protein [Leptospiraceae bacterium]|nr:inositol monophosphatase family protein [Leptospiraceae bacterium]
MSEYQNLIDLVIHTVRDCADYLRAIQEEHLNDYSYSTNLKNEVKSRLDFLLDDRILTNLKQTGFSILSEESGMLKGSNHREEYFIVDPLDGTLNFIRNSGPSAISIAFWNSKEPIFGVIYNLRESILYWGGKNYGSFQEEKQINTSKISMEKGTLFTGFPVRVNKNDEGFQKEFWEIINKFSKIRMIGSASLSLLNIARGSGECYYEKSIMLWDVAAGLAILKGAGGEFQMIGSNPDQLFSYDIFATNGIIKTMTDKDS